MSDTPTKPGFYWARRKGTQSWEPVALNTFGESVWLFGDDHPREMTSFEFGPEITKPEGLE